MEYIMMSSKLWITALSTVFFTTVLYSVLKFLRKYVWAPKSIERIMEAQGFRGPPRRILHGNVLEVDALRSVLWSTPMKNVNHHGIIDRLYPHYKLWSQKYGKRFMFWWGPEAAILVTEPDLVKEIFLASKHDGPYQKIGLRVSAQRTATSNGLNFLNGETWLAHRRIVNPAFRGERLKVSVAPMTASANFLVETWEKQIADAGPTGNNECTVDVVPDFIFIAADVISRAAYESNYLRLRSAFEQQLELLKLEFNCIADDCIPGFRFFPTKNNLRRMKMNRFVDSALRDEMRERGKSRLHSGADQEELQNKDLLAMLMRASSEAGTGGEGGNGTKYKLKPRELLDEVRVISAAGFDTVSITLTWAMFLLAFHPEWQDRLFQELQEEETKSDDGGVITMDFLNRLKIMTMVVNEVLRLYPTDATMSRTTVRPVQLGDLTLPKGMSVYICPMIMHRMPELWGEDADEFKPERFTNGLTAAIKHPVAYIPFAYGPRTCIGSSFAILETKTMLVTIIRRFRFRLHPDYQHEPVIKGVLIQPKNGLPLIFTRRDTDSKST